MNEKTLEVATMIMTGLLASSDYTEGAEHFAATDYGVPKEKRARYRSEVVNDSVELTVKLIAALKSVELVQ